ncbi:odv-e66b [Alphabaculovirus alterspexiguae]|uniref:Odv-e66b n=1 Tax=Spodoptera exigua multiple nucleopolyhedrovirus TaxID=10454 RepID=A0A3G2JU40_9ABAC|nr:odv-e66b [Spodoptera exigua multiple nucleopolyhedrovirus]AYN45063.1 odv-e66b [Spodoptera exigua multiple nucleopolyhedrovirus]
MAKGSSRYLQHCGSGCVRVVKKRANVMTALFVISTHNVVHIFVDCHINIINDNIKFVVDLKSFESYFRMTIWQTRKLRTDYIGDDDDAYYFDDSFSDDAEKFAKFLSHLNANGVLISVLSDEDAKIICLKLHSALLAMTDRLPFPGPHKKLPWNFEECHWKLFSIQLTECVMLLSIMMRPYIDVSDIALKIIDSYLPWPDYSMGWHREIENSTRMCIPFIYAQLCKGADIANVVDSPSVAKVVDQISYNMRNGGTGIHRDLVNFVDGGYARHYKCIITNYFTFNYYNFLLNREHVNMVNVLNSIHMVGSNLGILHPALLKDQSNVVKEILHYAPGVYSADFSKVVTVRNDSYFSSLVCPSNSISYYYDDDDDDDDILICIMTKRIWCCQKNYNQKIIDTGVILFEPLKRLNKLSYFPDPGYSAIASTDESAAVISFCKFENLNVEYYSYTLLYPDGMIQIYDKIKSTQKTQDAHCVLLVLDDEKAINTSQGCTIFHQDIENFKTMPKFELRHHEDTRYLCQPIDTQSINEGEATVCYGMKPSAAKSKLKIVRLDTSKNSFLIKVDETIECVFDFPYVVLKNNHTRRLTINNAYQSTQLLHTLYFDDINKVLKYVNLNAGNLITSFIKRTNYAFTYENTQENQFKFRY